MKWKLRNLYEEDCTFELLVAEDASPFVEFLKFILRNEERFSLKLKVTRKKGASKIKELSFTFEGQDEQIVTLKDLHLSGYQSWMEDPVRLFHSLDSHQTFSTQRALYREAEKKWNSANQLKEIFENKNGKGFDFKLDSGTYSERMKEQEKIMNDSRYKGALFPERIKEIYREHLHELENPPEKPEVITKPEHDHIEVELLTILADEDVTQDVKVEAGVTLNRYREKKEAESAPEESQKNNNALIAIKTIQEHYLK